MKTFLVKQKFRLGGERFDIKDDRGVVNYQVEGSFFQIPKTFTIYDAYGEQVSEISKEFRTSEKISIRPYGSIKFEYGKTGEVRLEIKDNSYYSIVPEAGIEFNYRQPFAKKATFTASLGIGYESELGKVNDRKNKARGKRWR